MRHLLKPCDASDTPYEAEVVFDLCISKVRNAALKTQLEGIREQVKRAAKRYDSAALNTSLHLIPRQSSVGGVSATELIKVYDGRMAGAKSPGRPVYDRIISGSKYQRCPLCNLGTVTTLDHHLPKTEYPALSVAPDNLVPACDRCQKIKRTKFPTTEGNQTLHPYYDNFESEVWLNADVISGHPAVFQFSVKAPSHWSVVTVDRLEEHMRSLGLGKLYASNAGSELAGIRTHLRTLHSSGGASAVQSHLIEVAKSWAAEFKNSWRAAMYNAGAANPWFCNGGFDL